MRFPHRMFHVAKSAAAALAALLLLAAPAAAQSAIEIPAENATTRAGKWVVTSDSTASGGGKTMRHPDAGASKLTTALETAGVKTPMADIVWGPMPKVTAG